MILKKGHLVNPATGTDAVMDIRFDNGIIQEIGTDLTPSVSEKVLDISRTGRCSRIGRHSYSLS